MRPPNGIDQITDERAGRKIRAELRVSGEFERKWKKGERSCGSKRRERSRRERIVRRKAEQFG